MGDNSSAACMRRRFFEADPLTLVQAGLACIPADSQYAACIRDVVAGFQENPDDWQKTWRRIDLKYQQNPANRRFSCNPGEYNIDAKINGAYVVIGLLYGRGDPDQTILISCRCGQDSDCNPSSAAGILFTAIGFERLPARFKEKLDETRVWSHTAYDFPRLISACEQVARAVVTSGGGRIANVSGEEVMVIPHAGGRIRRVGGPRCGESAGALRAYIAALGAAARRSACASAGTRGRNDQPRMAFVYGRVHPRFCPRPPCRLSGTAFETGRQRQGRPASACGDWYAGR